MKLLEKVRSWFSDEKQSLFFLHKIYMVVSLVVLPFAAVADNYMNWAGKTLAFCFGSIIVNSIVYTVGNMLFGRDDNTSL